MAKVVQPCRRASQCPGVVTRRGQPAVLVLKIDNYDHNPENLSVKDIPDLDVALEEKSSWVVPTVVHNLVMIIMMIMMMMLLLMIIMIKTMTMMKREWWEWLANISYLDQKEFIAWSKGGRDLWNINIRWIFSRFSKKNI